MCVSVICIFLADLIHTHKRITSTAAEQQQQQHFGISLTLVCVGDSFPVTLARAQHQQHQAYKISHTNTLTITHTPLFWYSCDR